MSPCPPSPLLGGPGLGAPLLHAFGGAFCSALEPAKPFSVLSFPDELTRHSFLGESTRPADSPRPPRTLSPRPRPRAALPHGSTRTHFPSWVFLMMNRTTLLMSMKRMRRPMSPPTTPTMMSVTVLSVSTTAGEKVLRGLRRGAGSSQLHGPPRKAATPSTSRWPAAQRGRRPSLALQGCQPPPRSQDTPCTATTVSQGGVSAGLHPHCPSATRGAREPWPALTLLDHREEDGGIVLRVLLLGVLDVAGVFPSVAELHILQDNGDVVVLPGRRADELDPWVASHEEGLRGFALYLAVVNLQRQGCRTRGQLGPRQPQVRERLEFSCCCPAPPLHAQTRTAKCPGAPH